MAEGPVRAPCPTPSLDENDRRDLAKSFGLHGTEIKRFSRTTRDVPLWLSYLMPMDFAVRRHPVALRMVRRFMKQADDARRWNKHFGEQWDKLTGYDPRTKTIRRMTPKEQADYASLVLKTEEKDWLTDD